MKNFMTNDKFIIIEFDILDNPDLTNTEKILYGYIAALSKNEYGCCFMKTSSLCKLVNLKERQLLYCLNKLKKFNYITTTVIKNKRYITPTINKFIEEREKINKNLSINPELENYNWLEDE